MTKQKKILTQVEIIQLGLKTEKKYNVVRSITTINYLEGFLNNVTENI